MKRSTESVAIEIEEGDVTAIPADSLVLKYAQALHGADQEVADQLEREGVRVRADLPRRGQTKLIRTLGAISAETVLFVGVQELFRFRYSEIREFARQVLEFLAEDLPEARSVLITVHGVQYGLDEFEAFEAQVAGFVDAISEFRFPLNLERITIGERDPARVVRLKRILQQIIPDGKIDLKRRTFADNLGEERVERLRSAGYATERKPHIFVAMPFSEEMQNVYEYPIVLAAKGAGFVCERADLSTFTGDVLSWIKKRIKTAALVIADLTGANPNVYLEVGYAWGCGVPTVLVVRSEEDLRFDVRNQRCIIYGVRIKELEKQLTEELTSLRDQLDI